MSVKIKNVTITRVILDLNQDELEDLANALAYATGKSNMSSEYDEWLCELHDKLVEQYQNLYAGTLV